MVNDTSCTDLLVTGVSFAALIERSTQNRNNNRTANEGPSLFPRFPFLCRDAFHAGQNVTGFSNTFFTGFDAPWQTAFLFPARTKPLSLSPPSISPSFSLLHFPFSPFFWIGSGAFCSISESRAISRGWWSPRRVFRHHFVTFARFYGGCSRERERYALRSMLRIPFRTLYSATRNFFAVYRCRSKVFFRNRHRDDKRRSESEKRRSLPEKYLNTCSSEWRTLSKILQEQRCKIQRNGSDTRERSKFVRKNSQNVESWSKLFYPIRYYPVLSCPKK